MLRILRSFSDKVRVHSGSVAAIAGSVAIGDAFVRGGASLTLGSIRYLSNRVAFRSASAIVEQRIQTPNARSIRRELSFTATALFSYRDASATIASVELSVDHLAHLKSKPMQMREAKAAISALMAAEDHPSRSLLLRLMADETMWSSVYDEWKKLVDNKANWEYLASMLISEGAGAVYGQLQTVYGLTAGTADAVVSLLHDVKRQDFVAVPMNSNKEGISALGATVSRFVDWCGAEKALNEFAKTGLEQPLVIAGAIKTGKSMLLRHVLPGAIKAVHINKRFLVLPVDWSCLRDARDFATVFRGFQSRIAAVLREVGIAAPLPVTDQEQGLRPYLMDVEQKCLLAGYRPIHLWDEAPFLFTFDTPASSPMYVALKPVLHDPNRKSVYAMTGTASQVLLRVIADQLPNGSNPWSHTHRIIIPTPHPVSERVKVERAARRALGLFFKEHPGHDRFTVSDIKKYWTNKDVVITPAIAVEVARTMPHYQSKVDLTVRALQSKIDDEWGLETLQTLYHMEWAQRKKIRKIAETQQPQVLNERLLPKTLYAVRNVLFHTDNTTATSRGPPKAVMVPSYARRVLAAILPNGALNPQAFPVHSVVRHLNINLKIDLFRALHESMPKTALNDAGHPIRPFLERSLTDTFGAVTKCDPRTLEWFSETVDLTAFHNKLVLDTFVEMALPAGMKNINFDFRTLPDDIRKFDPASIAVFLEKLAGNFFVYENDDEKRLEGYMALEKAGVVNFLFNVIKHLKSAPNKVF